MFRALQNSLQVSLKTAKACIVTMAVLYNIKLDFDNDFQYEDEEDEYIADAEEDHSAIEGMEMSTGMAL